MSQTTTDSSTSASSSSVRNAAPAIIDPTAVLSTALHLARHGIPVFPCRPGTKVPAITSAHPAGDPCRGECGREGHGFLDATTDTDTITRWWTHWPTANLAIPTGITPTGTVTVDVLDVDKHADGTGYPAFRQIKAAELLGQPCRIVATPSGGLHLYFRGSTQPSGRLPRHHIDFKASGGYILVPPSVVNGHAYEAIQHTPGASNPLDWTAIRALLDPPAPARPRRSSDTDPQGITALAAWVTRLPEGQRNTGLFWAACTALEEGADDLTPLLDAALTTGLTQPEATRTITSAHRRITNGPPQ